jgi:hypothetical protein
MPVMEGVLPGRRRPRTIRIMPRVRRLLLPLLAAAGMLFTLGWTGAVMACPANAVVAHAPAFHSRTCPHPRPPARPQPLGHDGPMCTAVCIGVLPPFVEVAAAPLMQAAPSLPRLSPLDGFDPALEPPPPRIA